MPISPNARARYEDIVNQINARERQRPLTPKEDAARRRLEILIKDPTASPYRVFIPGWDDIIVVKERDEASIYDLGLIGWLKNNWEFEVQAFSPSPEIVQRFAHWMTFIDDIEDLVSTVIWLGRPLLRRIGARLLPVIGPVLLARDLFEIAYAAINILPGNKQSLEAALEDTNLTARFVKPKGSRLLRAKILFGRLLEAGQALLSLIGYGLRLGPILGLAMDSFFGGIRSLFGEAVEYVWSRRTTLEERAARVILQSWQIPELLKVLTPPGQMKLLIGYSYATQIAAESKLFMNIEQETRNRFSLDSSMEGWMPFVKPTNPLVRWFAQEHGVDPDAYPPDHPREPLRLYVDATGPSAENAIALTLSSWGLSPWGAFLATTLKQSAFELWDNLGRDEPPLKRQPDRYLINMFNLMLNDRATLGRINIERFIDLVITITNKAEEKEEIILSGDDLNREIEVRMDEHYWEGGTVFPPGVPRNKVTFEPPKPPPK